MKEEDPIDAKDQNNTNRSDIKIEDQQPIILNEEDPSNVQLDD